MKNCNKNMKTAMNFKHSFLIMINLKSMLNKYFHTFSEKKKKIIIKNQLNNLEQSLWLLGLLFKANKFNW